MWDLPGPGLEPVSPALAGGFLTTVPQGKSLEFGFDTRFLLCLLNFKPLLLKISSNLTLVERQLQVHFFFLFLSFPSFFLSFILLLKKVAMNIICITLVKL